MMITYTSPCILCRQNIFVHRKYLRPTWSGNILRDLAYLLPLPLAGLLSTRMSRFRHAYRPVETNRRYFNVEAVYCLHCFTGYCLPGFDRQGLEDYYKDFYWDNRDLVDGHHIPLEDQPNERQICFARDRADWISRHLSDFGSVLDFGAGDCAGAFHFNTERNVGAVHVVDPSKRSQELARQYGFHYSSTLSGISPVNLVYSAHSIEHVHDLKTVLIELIRVLQKGGYLFFETPNIANPEIFNRLTHTPHTFMLSLRTFELLSEQLPIAIVASEASGLKWQIKGKPIAANAPPDLRVLLKKIGEI